MKPFPQFILATTLLLVAASGVEASDSASKEPLNQRVESKSGIGGIHLAAANGPKVEQVKTFFTRLAAAKRVLPLTADNAARFNPFGTGGRRNG